MLRRSSLWSTATYALRPGKLNADFKLLKHPHCIAGDRFAILLSRYLKRDQALPSCQAPDAAHAASDRVLLAQEAPLDVEAVRGLAETALACGGHAPCKAGTKGRCSWQNVAHELQVLLQASPSQKSS